MNKGHLSIYGFLSLLILILVSCEKDPDIISESDPRTILDVAYGSHDKQKMDVYLPANRSTEDTRVIIYAHGGGFIAGDRKDVDRVFIDHFVSQGWAVVNVSYRLVNSEWLGPQANSDIQIIHQVADLSAAVDHVLAHARDWAVNGYRIGLAGHSAGGTLALLYAYSDHNRNGKVKAAANWAGALDLAFTKSDIDGLNVEAQFILYELLHRFTGHSYTPENLSHLQAISPHYVVHSEKPIPIINIFPENNDVADLPRQDRETYDLFTSQLNILGIPNRFVQLDGTDHGFNGNEAKIHVINETIEFFNEYLN